MDIQNAVDAEQQKRIDELERRIGGLERADEASFGAFSRLDWAVCIVGSVVLPYLAFVWFCR